MKGRWPYHAYRSHHNNHPTQRHNRIGVGGYLAELEHHEAVRYAEHGTLSPNLQLTDRTATIASGHCGHRIAVQGV
jgi:hypothetical protein